MGHRPACRNLLIGALLASAFPAAAWSQSAQMPPERLEEKLETVSEAPREKPEEQKKKSKPDLLIVPIPQSSPTLGSGATLAAALFYNPNESKDPWISAVGYMKTSNGSWGAGAMQKMAFDHDRFRLTLFGGYGDVNIRFYGIGSGAAQRDFSVELNERGFAGMINGQMRVAGNLYAGGRLISLSLDTAINKENPLFPDAELPTRAFTSKLVKAGPAITYDSRDSGLNPKAGEFANIAWLFGVDGLGSDYSHNKLTLDVNIYRSLSKNTVIAGRASACAVSTDAPFYDMCMYGTSSDLRGYETGKYRDRATWALQAEIRQHLFWRIGAVAFAGGGMSAPGWSKLDQGKWLPSAGLGLRLQPSKSTPINLRIDHAWGRDSKGLYISVGEAF